MLPKTGKNVPPRGGDGGTGSPYATVVAAALRRELGDTHRAIKIVMRWTGASERTVKHWYAGTTGPNGEHLIALLSQSDEVLEACLMMAGRKHAIAAQKLIEARDVLADTLERIVELTR